MQNSFFSIQCAFNMECVLMQNSYIFDIECVLYYRTASLVYNVIFT